MDGKVDAHDLNVVGLNWLRDVTGWCSGDFTANGVVDASNLNKLAFNWRQDVSGEAAAVHERVPRAPLANIVDAVLLQDVLNQPWYNRAKALSVEVALTKARDAVFHDAVFQDTLAHRLWRHHPASNAPAREKPRLSDIDWELVDDSLQCDWYEDKKPISASVSRLFRDVRYERNCVIEPSHHPADVAL